MKRTKGAGRLAALSAATAVVLVLSAAPATAEGTISDMVENSFASEMPFWKYLYKNGFGYLDSSDAARSLTILCANRGAGVPDSQIVDLLKIRGYSLNEAQAILIAAGIPSDAHPACAS